MSRLELFNRGAWRELLGKSAVLPSSSRVEAQKKTGDRNRTQLAESAVQNLPCTWESCRRPDKLWKVRRWHEATLNALRDPEKRPRFPRHPFPRELVYPEPEVEFDLDEFRFARNLRSAKRGRSWGFVRHDCGTFTAVAGPSPRSQGFIRASEQLSRARVPRSIREAVRLERLTALQKPNGGVRGVVAGDIVRSPARHSTVPVRVGDEEWMREHRSRCARIDRVESAHHCDFHRRNKRVRFDFASGHAGWGEAHCSWIGIRHYRSYQCFMGIPQVLCGKMQLATSTPSRRVQVEKRATQFCPCSR